MVLAFMFCESQTQIWHQNFFCDLALAYHFRLSSLSLRNPSPTKSPEHPGPSEYLLLLEKISSLILHPTPCITYWCTENAHVVCQWHVRGCTQTCTNKSAFFAWLMTTSRLLWKLCPGTCWNCLSPYSSTSHFHLLDRPLSRTSLSPPRAVLH